MPDLNSGIAVSLRQAAEGHQQRVTELQALNEELQQRVAELEAKATEVSWDLSECFSAACILHPACGNTTVKSVRWATGG